MRWELCKIWRCRVDDEIFSGINEQQWAWYAEMIIADKANDQKSKMNYIEYLASFWNYEAVKSIQDARSADERHTFASDQEFDDQVKTGAYKDNEFLDAVKALKEITNFNTNDSSNSSDRFRVPRNLSSLRSLIEDD